MERSVCFDITGKPVAKGRGRIGQVGGRPMIFTPNNTRKWERDARMVARQHMQGRPPFHGPISLNVLIIFEIPKSWPSWKRDAAMRGDIAHTTKPDADNILKAAKDAMNGIIWLDDCQVCDINVRKRYGDTPMVSVLVSPTKQHSAQITKKPETAAAAA